MSPPHRSPPRSPPHRRTDEGPPPESPRPGLSVVIPVFDEEQSLPQLQRQIAEHVGGMGIPWEVVYVDDHSADGSYRVLLDLHAADPHVRVVRLRRNFGQTAALAAGFETSRGAIVVTMDADLQNDPADVPALVAELQRGHDLVVGWRRRRRDGFWLRRLPSRLANRLIAAFTGAHVHDTGCTLKAFRRELLENLPIYAEQHRFLPVLAMARGARISELEVNHRPRLFGRSKYGLSRAVRVLGDLLTVKMIASFSRAPLRYFALLATPFLLATLLLALEVAWRLGTPSLRDNWGQAALLTFMLLSMACAYLLMLGLLAELAIKVSRLHRPDSLPLRSVPRP